MDGWDTYYLGANTPTESVIRALVDRRAQVLGISATITYHVRDVEALVRAVRAAAACRNVKILVGGYPFNMAPGLWQKIGADGFARDAQGAIELAGRLVRPEGRA
jgi:methanogenic corrinoid protein MtbC1